MELYKEILAEIFKKENIHVTFPNLDMKIDDIVEIQCYKALKKSKTS